LLFCGRHYANVSGDERLGCCFNFGRIMSLRSSGQREKRREGETGELQTVCVYVCMGASGASNRGGRGDRERKRERVVVIAIERGE